MRFVNYFLAPYYFLKTVWQVNYAAMTSEYNKNIQEAQKRSLAKKIADCARFLQLAWETFRPHGLRWLYQKTAMASPYSKNFSRR